MTEESKAIDLLHLRTLAKEEMWKAWADLSIDRDNPEKLHIYLQQLRRTDHLHQIPLE